jgi:hypothetical protein
LPEVSALLDIGIDAAIGMAVYTGTLSLDRLRELAV